ncbi:tryptophan synthase beta subunit-like PLP-dependent enzyme [Ephemerocybe angulata]|uniref:cysteine synthase n=1 Tax=Ephemerocybe angulata TaxID=980116 RepID=A0A8H6IFA4_9AGAR|nr:tryptophan synthase beta subunit-like PLP-dependent enzyme [Tulosesus angulatus]
MTASRLPFADFLPIHWLQWPSRTTAKHVFYGFLIGLSLSLTTSSLAMLHQSRKKEKQASRLPPRPIELRSDEIVNGVTGLIGNTPLMRINSLSDALGVEILGKAEFLNPGGSVKDRVALRMIEDAESLGFLRPHTGSRIFEGTVGSTGISIATVARSRGYESTIIMPDDVAEEKVKALHALGAEVERVRPASIVDKKQFVNLAKMRASEFGEPDKIDASIDIDAPRAHHHRALESPSHTMLVSTTAKHVNFDTSNDWKTDEDFLSKPRGFFADQFENRSNFDAHFAGTGPEIWRQTNGQVDAFVSGAGTGGTLAGCGRYIKSVNEDTIVAISDPEGSGLFNKVKYGVMFDRREAEGTKRRHQVDTVVEGIGINRLTHNFELALPIVDDAFRISDAEAVAMSRFLVRHDGLFLGSSSACNVMACIKLVKKMGWEGSGKHVVTILCDSGTRHYSKFWSDEYLKNAGIAIDLSLVEDLLPRPDSV